MSTIAIDWRMPATVTTSAGISAYQAAIATAQSASNSKSRPNFVAPLSATNYVEYVVGATGTAILSWLGQSGTVTITLNTVDQGYTPIFPSGSSVGGVSGTGGRRQFMKMSVTSGDTIRFTIDAGASNRTIYPLLHLIPSSGGWDSHVVFGASREAEGWGCQLMEDAIIADDATRDPIIFNYAVAGQVLSQIETNVSVAAPIYSGTAFYACMGNLIGNNVTASRPYTAGQKTAIDAAFANIAADVTGYEVAWGNTSYRAYTGVYPSAQTNGSLPYNTNVVDPAIATYAAAVYDSTLLRSWIDEYVNILYNRGGLTDEIHGAYPQARAVWVATWFKYTKTGTWTGITPQVEVRVAAAEASATTKQTALINYNEATWALDAIDPLASAKAALVARMAVIYPSVLFYEAVRLIDIAEESQSVTDKSTAQAMLTAAQSAGYAGVTPPNTIAAQQARLNAVSIVSFDQTIKIRFGSNTAVATWNSTDALAGTGTGVAIADCLDDTGAATGVSITITNAGTGVSTSQPQLSQVASIPDSVLLNAWLDTSASGTYVTGNLDPSRLYNVLLMPVRSSATDSLTRYTVNGAVQTPDIPPKNNTNLILMVGSVSPDVSGNITVTFGRGAGSSLAYHSAMIIQRHAVSPGYSAFQSNAFQTNAFQIYPFSPEQPETNQASNWKLWPDHEVKRRNREYRNGIKRKQDEIIGLKLEAQEIALKKKEIKDAKDKQSKRQMDSLEKQEDQILAEIKASIESLERLEAKLIMEQNEEVLVLLQLAYPFLNLGR